MVFSGVLYSRRRWGFLVDRVFPREKKSKRNVQCDKLILSTYPNPCSWSSFSPSPRLLRFRQWTFYSNGQVRVPSMNDTNLLVLTLDNTDRIPTHSRGETVLVLGMLLGHKRVTNRHSPPVYTRALIPFTAYAIITCEWFMPVGFLIGGGEGAKYSFTGWVIFGSTQDVWIEKVIVLHNISNYFL